MYQFDQLNLTFEQLDKRTVQKAIDRFRDSAEFMAFAGIKLGFGEKRRPQNEVNAEVVAAICRAWLAATEEPPMKRIQVDWRG